MGLNSALVDQARITRATPQPRRVESGVLFADVEFPWFRARLELPRAVEGRDGAGGKRKTVSQPTLMYGRKDSSGQPVAVNSEDKLEVNSKQLGRSLWDVVSAPEPIRKKRTVIGWQVTLRRSDTPTFEHDVAEVTEVGRSLRMPFWLEGLPGDIILPPVAT